MIRKMTDRDMPAVLAIWLAGNFQAHPFVPQEYWQGQLPKMEQEYLPSAEVWVYEDEADFVIKGFIGIVDKSYIAGLFVLPVYQGQGIGKLLLHHCQRQYSSLELSVYLKNERAICFYERNGFYATVFRMDESTGEKEQIMEWKNQNLRE